MKNPHHCKISHREPAPRTLHLTAPHLCSGRCSSRSPRRDTAARGSDVGRADTCGLGEGCGRHAGSRNGSPDVDGFALRS